MSFRSKHARGFIRREATWVKHPDDWTFLVLYDPANAEAVRATGLGPMSFPKGEKSIALRRIAKARTAVFLHCTQGTRGEYPVSLEVAVGDALGAAEAPAVPWMQPWQALLQVPSGRLHLQEFVAFFDRRQSGSLVKLPPGDYRLTLQGVNWEALPKQGGGGWKGPHGFLALTPRAPGRERQGPGDILLVFETRPAADRPGWIRKDATPLSIYNDASVVFLYDQSHRAAIEATELGRVRPGYAEAWKAVPELSSKGILLVYDLQQDDSLSIEVAVGQPLTPKEAKAARWLPPQVAWLRLPSGRLCVDSINTWPIGPNGGSDRGKGAVLKVPAGDYRMSLHRVDWDAMETARWRHYRGPQEFITLTQIGPREKVPRAADVLPFPPREQGRRTRR